MLASRVLCLRVAGTVLRGHRAILVSATVRKMYRWEILVGLFIFIKQPARAEYRPPGPETRGDATAQRVTGTKRRLPFTPLCGVKGAAKQPRFAKRLGARPKAGLALQGSSA